MKQCGSDDFGGSHCECLYSVHSCNPVFSFLQSDYVIIRHEAVNQRGLDVANTLTMWKIQTTPSKQALSLLCVQAGRKGEI